MIGYTRKNACSFTAFNSTDIRPVQDNVATPVTAMMVSLYDGHWCLIICIDQSRFISAVGSSCIHACRLLRPVLTDCNGPVPNIPVSFCYIRLIQPWQTNRLFQSDTVSSEQSVGDNSLIQLWYHTCIRPEGATGCNRSVAFLRV